MKYTICELDGEKLRLTTYHKRKGQLFLVEDRMMASSEFSQEDFSGHGVIVAVIDPIHLRFRALPLPDLGREKLLDIVPIELKATMVGDTEDFQFGVVDVGDGSVLATWVPKAVVSETLAALARIGITPDVVTSHLCHLAALASPVTLEILTDGAQIAFVQRGRPVYLGCLPADEQGNPLEALAKRLPPAGGEGQVTISVFGDEAFSLAETEETPFPVGFLIPGDGAYFGFGDNGSAFVCLAASYATAMAVAADRHVDFLYGEYVPEAAITGRRRQRLVTKVLVTLLAALLLVQAGYQYYRAEKRLNAVDAQIERVYHELYPSRKKAADEVLEIKSEMKGFVGIGAGVDALEIMKTLSTAKTDGIIGVYDVSIDASHAVVKGTARSSKDVASLRGTLSKSYTSVKVGEESAAQTGVGFTLNIAFNGGGSSDVSTGKP